jgi:coenzyme F420-0:L-glutamate ligase / coenzyme F420-1:gamma-L-glutamate ligase
LKLSVEPVPGLPEITPGDDLAALISSRAQLEDGDIVVIAQKAVSKSEDRFADPACTTPTTGKDPGLVQLILDQSSEVLRAADGVLIVETRQGFICANAGIDGSNVPGDGRVLLLPKDSDASARTIRKRLSAASGHNVAVLITDSFGRAWRHGQLDLAIGLAGMQPLDDWRGRRDSSGLQLRATWLAVADAAGSIAELVRAKDSREPVAIIEGLERFMTGEDGPGAAELLRPLEQDLFR